jgi:hypothetical protein
VTPTLVTLIAARVILIVQLVLGVLFWTGNTLNLIPVHMLVGLLLVLVMWTASALAIRARAPVGLVGLALLWSLVLPVFGVAHTGLLPGPAHVVIQILHLLVGVIAVGLVEGLGRASRVRGKAAAS